MLYKTAYKIYDILSENDCESIINFCIANGEGGDGNRVFDATHTNTRKSKIKWIDSKKIYDTITPVISESNKTWKISLEKIERLQFTQYDVGDSYGWHVDNDGETYKHPDPLAGLTRKLSFSLLLSDEFEGGEFEVECGHPGNEGNRIQTVTKLKKGSILIFPSYTAHRVKPVTSGVRYSLVGWCCGPQWT